MFIPYTNFSIPDPRSKGFLIPDPESHQRIQVFLTQKIVSKLSEIGSGMFTLDPDLDFLPIPDHGSRGQKGPRIPDPQHWVRLIVQ
jgi:hypothetical protein